MKKALLLLAILMLTSCGGRQSSAPQNQVKSALGAWKLIAIYEGDSMKNTPTFNIPSDEWRISWQASPGKIGAGNFAITVVTASGETVGLAANVMGESTDASYMHGAGSYYLKIFADEKYKIAIESH